MMYRFSVNWNRYTLSGKQDSVNRNFSEIGSLPIRRHGQSLPIRSSESTTYLQILMRLRGLDSESKISSTILGLPRLRA